MDVTLRRVPSVASILRSPAATSTWLGSVFSRRMSRSIRSIGFMAVIGESLVQFRLAAASRPSRHTAVDGTSAPPSMTRTYAAVSVRRMSRFSDLHLPSWAPDVRKNHLTARKPRQDTGERPSYHSL
jgi:hypothetical protein